MRQALWALLRGIGLLGLFAVSIVLAENVFINTGLRVLVNLRPELLRATWTGAVTVWPGSVEVWGLAIRAQDASTQWQVTVGRASGEIDLRALADYRFVARNVVGDSASIRVRQRRSEPLTAGAADATPPIDGLENPPLNPPEAGGAPPRPFRVELPSFTLEHVRELWVGDYRYFGEARLTGGVDVLDKQWVAVDGLKLELASGAVALGPEPIASEVHGEVSLSMPRVNPAEMSGGDILEQLVARVAVEANVQDLRFLSFYLQDAPWVGLEGGEGPIEVDISLAEGRVLDGSRLGVNAKGVQARVLSYTVSGDANVRAEVAPIAGVSTASLSVDFFDFGIVRTGDTPPHVRGTGLRLTATTTSLGLGEPPENLAITIDIPDSEVPDISVYSGYLPRDLGFELLGGAARIHGQLQASTENNSATGDLFLSSGQLRARLGDVLVAGEAALQAHLIDGNFDTNTYDISGSSLRLQNVGVVGRGPANVESDRARGWWALIRVPRGKVSLSSRYYFDADLAVACRDSVPVVTLFSQVTPLPRWARGLLHIADLRGKARLRLGETVMLLDHFKLQGAGTEVLMTLRRRGLSFEGNLLATYLGLSVGVELHGEKAKLHVLSPRRWYHAQPNP